jgi:hypothetical protein
MGKRSASFSFPKTVLDFTAEDEITEHYITVTLIHAFLDEKTIHVIL